MTFNIKSIRCVVCGSYSTNNIFRSNNSHGRHVIDDKEIFKILKCDTCNALFVGDIDMNNTSFYKKYYSMDYYNPDSIGRIKIANKVAILLERISCKLKEGFVIRRVKKKLVRIIDVGCGSGVFLGCLNQKKFKRYGLEINSDGVKLCKERNIPVFSTDLLKTNFNNKKFDAVTLIHVLEHLVSPLDVLRKINTIMSHDGVLIVVVPNNRSLGCKLGNQNWFHLDCPRHIFIPSKETIEWLAETSGFIVKKIINEFYDYPLDLFWSIRHSRLRFCIYPLYPFFKVCSKETLTFVLQKK